jgi:hypothetical protein
MEFTKEELKIALKQMLSSPHKDLIAEALDAMLNEYSWRRDLLMKAALGIRPQSQLRLYDEYLVRANWVSSYKRDDVKSKEVGLIDVNDNIKCTLVGFKPWENPPYRIEYECINNNGDRVTFVDDIGYSQLKSYEDFPEDLI